MYDTSGKNHLVVNRYCVILQDSSTITIYNVRQIVKVCGIVKIYFFQNKTEPLIIEQNKILDILKQIIDRSVIL